MLANNFLPVHNIVVFVILCVHVLVATVCLRHIRYLNFAMHSFNPLRQTCSFINKTYCIHWNNDGGNANMVYSVFTKPINIIKILFSILLFQV